MTTNPDVSWTHLSGFVRQHTHDLRNELNGLDLEAALLADMVTDSESRETVARMRAEIRKVAADLRALSAKFANNQPTLLRLKAQELYLIWQDQWKELNNGLQIEWQSKLGEEHVEVDPNALAQAFRELLVNASSHSAVTGATLRATAAHDESEIVFELSEPKTQTVDPARWGKNAFVTTRRGSYGLGLCSLLRAVESCGGTVCWRFEEAERTLVTRIAFPLA